MASGFVTTGLPPNASIKRSMKMQVGSLDNDLEATSLQTQDNLQTKPPLYIYNICELSHVRNQPPEFPGFTVEPCPKGEKFSVKVFQGIVNERYMKPGTSEFYYKQVDGRKYATSLLNPDCFPGTDFEAQLIEGQTGNNDMTGMNMNALGVFWSPLAPDDPKLEAQIKKFRARVDRTMDALVKEGNRLNASGKLGDISAMMHFAMDYFGLQATWHMSHRHKTECPNCGELVLEGVAYHKNGSGDDCIIDYDRYAQVVMRKATVQETKPARTRSTR
jgi:hypothetical protein